MSLSNKLDSLSFRLIVVILLLLVFIGLRGLWRMF